MNNTPVARRHDRFEDVLRIEEKRNGRRTTRVIFIADCRCGFSTNKKMARVQQRGKERWTKDSITAMNAAKKEARREYLLHLNGNYEPG